MTLTKNGYFGYAGGGKNGAVVDAWLASRFTSAPGEGSSPPSGLPDAGPVTTGVNYGGPGAYSLPMPEVADYYIRVQYGGNTYWSECSAGSIGGAIGTAIQFGTPADPNGTTSNGLVMMGLGLLFSPESTGNVIAQISGILTVSGSAGLVNVGAAGYYGLGAAPANGAPVAGTPFPQGNIGVQPTVAPFNGAFFSCIGTLSGLSVVGVDYWFDIAVSSDGTHTAAPIALTSLIQEVR